MPKKLPDRATWEARRLVLVTTTCATCGSSFQQACRTANGRRVRRSPHRSRWYEWHALGKPDGLAHVLRLSEGPE